MLHRDQKKPNAALKAEMWGPKQMRAGKVMGPGHVAPEAGNTSQETGNPQITWGPPTRLGSQSHPKLWNEVISGDPPPQQFSGNQDLTERP